MLRTINRTSRILRLSATKTRFGSTLSAATRPLDTYLRRHVGSESADVSKMLRALDYATAESAMDTFVSEVVPPNILTKRPLAVKPTQGFSESELTSRLGEIASKNKVFKSYIGKGYVGTVVPPVIQRNVLENPLWYTSYTPYQPEISQGRLESLLNYQTVITELTGMAVANASLLDEGTAASEAVTMAFNAFKGKRGVFLVDKNVHPQTIAVVQSRSEALEVDVKVVDVNDLTSGKSETPIDQVCGVLVQYPTTDGSIVDYQTLSDTLKGDGKGSLLCVSADLLALTLLKPPSDFGADIVLGTSQRFGVPMGYGGPHAAYFAVADGQHRKMPGRLIGMSRDRLGGEAYRLALQTREQHIRREKATSNICTAQALLANMSAFYAIYHGPEGLKNIAERVNLLTSILAAAVEAKGVKVLSKHFFDTLTLEVQDANKIIAAAEAKEINLYKIDDKTVSLTLDETVTHGDLVNLASVFGVSEAELETAASNVTPSIPSDMLRTDKYMQHDVFNKYHSETELLRYMKHLQSKDLSLADAMIPLGSCTMKLNATTQMAPITWPEFGQLHPFVPLNQAQGYKELLIELEDDLADITGFDRMSLQPNSGAQGEYTGLRVIRAYLESQGQGHRNICLIPVSAHGTNPASAVMSGMKVVAVKCKKDGELDLADLAAKAEKHKDNLAAFMVTYPSTFGVFEPGVKEAIDIVHKNGGQVYMDGANMNAQIGLTSPGEMGADVCHLNLHKTFCIPHGGGGPGMGPIGVKSHLAPFLPAHPVVEMSEVTGLSTDKSIQPVSAAPFGSASILPISWAYIKLMGATGLLKATEIALLNANYMKKRLEAHYPILYTNNKDKCAHEFILDMRPFKASSGIEAIDIAKRLQDYSFHGPTMSWPVANTLMVEPTESESLAELDRFCDALISIRQEIKEIEDGKVPRENNVLKNAPHPQQDLLAETWDRPYTREQAAYPVASLREKKFWPSVARVDDTFGDLNLFCTCEPPALEE
ncbi:Glycine dehydrogenase (decarboxylating) [Yarrowia sp. B02]|nr:Glycine dehydrogenase (decarboxylating) [Yarrowia sp. B02]